MPVAEALPRANVIDTRSAFPSDRFVTIANVPVFAEHETTARDGRILRFTRRELEQVCQRCNRRIQDTGDYAAISLGHTPEPDSDKPEPELIGFAGPFRIGLVGQPGKQKYAVCADFHILKQDYGKFIKHPRRSPELWLEDRYEEMFLDPIALLGAEAPRLDMGLTALYSAMHGGRLVEKYAAAGAAAPSADSVFIPEHVNTKTKTYQPEPKGNTPMLTPDDIRQIVDAIEQLDWVQGVKSMLTESQGDMGSLPQEEAGAEIPPPAGPEAELPAPAPAAKEPPLPPAAAGPPPPKAPAAGPEDKEKLARYAAADSMKDEEFDEYCEKRKAKYAAEKGDIAADKETSAEKGEGDLEPTKEKFAKAFDSMQRRLTAAEAAVNTEKEKRINAERYQILATKRQCYAFDLDAEYENCKYGKVSDEQFQRHAGDGGTIDSNYREMPLNAPFIEAIGPSTAPRQGIGGKKEKYTKEHHDKAFKLAEAKKIAGQDVDYLAILEEVVAGKL